MLLTTLNKISGLVFSHRKSAGWLAGMACVAILASGCKTQTTSDTSFSDIAAQAGKSTNVVNVSRGTNHTESVVLREGDVVKITFPGASNLNGNHSIGRDGNITLEMVGELKAAGKTVSELKADVLKAYADKIETHEASVELISSAFPVFVTGAVIHPGKVTTDHPMTALEAVMESGGFDYTKANLKSVVVLRQNGDQLKSFTLDMKKVMIGKKSAQFYLKPLDIIYVREKFSWF